MSEPIFPAGAGTAAPAAAEPSTEGRSNRKALLALGGVLGAVVVGGGAFFLLNQSAPADEAGPVVKKPASSAQPDAGASPAAKPNKPVTVKVARVTSHDPFAVLFPEVKTSDSGGTAGSGTTTTPGGSSTAAPSGTTATPPPDQSTSTSYKVGVTIIKPDTEVAQITVNGKPYSVGVGKPFAQYFTLYAIFNKDCVGVLFGDQNVPVCKNSNATVTS